MATEQVGGFAESEKRQLAIVGRTLEGSRDDSKAPLEGLELIDVLRAVNEHFVTRAVGDSQTGVRWGAAVGGHCSAQPRVPAV